MCVCVYVCICACDVLHVHVTQFCGEQCRTDKVQTRTVSKVVGQMGFKVR